MLMSMQQLATAEPSPDPSSDQAGFAKVLAGFTASGKKPPESDLDGLEDDIATFSYEQDLRTHPAPRTATAPAARTASASQESPAVSASGQKARRAASVTVRLSASEAEQLHLRAAEAGITVSAYMRSCAFEVDALRAEVKSTVAELRAATAARPEPPPVRKRPWFRIWSRHVTAV